MSSVEPHVREVHEDIFVRCRGSLRRTQSASWGDAIVGGHPPIGRRWGQYVVDVLKGKFGEVADGLVEDAVLEWDIIEVMLKNSWIKTIKAM